MGTHSVRVKGEESSELPGCPSPAHTARSAASPPRSKGCTGFPPCQRELSGEDSLDSPGQQHFPLPDPFPVLGRWDWAGPVTGWSFLAVLVEGCIVVEHLGNRARPHPHPAHPMVTAEPAQRLDGRWHLSIFSFLLHWIKSWKQGVWTPGNQNTTAHAVHTADGDGADLAHQPAKTLCVKEAVCFAPIGLCGQLCG